MLQILYKCVILFLILKNVESKKILDVYNLKSINDYFNNVSERVKSDLFNVRLMMQHEKKNVLKRIATEFIDSIKKLDRTESSSEYYNWTKNYNNLIKIFERFALKSNNSLLNAQSISRVSVIEENSFLINSYAALMASYPESVTLTNIIDFCPFLPQIIQKFYSFVNSDSIMDRFNNLMDDILTEIGKEKKDNVCGQRSSLHEVWFIYYHRVMITFLKQMLMQFYSEVFQAICNNEYTNNTMNLFWSNLSGVLERSIKTQQTLQQKINYMYRCDPTDYHENGGHQAYYELERMIQTLIVNEKDLSTTQSCSTNCNLETIQNTINYNECREFKDCRFMTNSFKVCKEKEGKSKRYRWFENRYRARFGEDTGKNCSEPIESIEGYFYFPQMRYCDYCVCTCVAQPKQSNNVVTAVSFREQVTNIFQNMVVVGVRFVKKNYMIHVQIKARRMRTHGLNDSGFWQELETFSVSEQTGGFVVINNNTESPLFVGIDYGNPRIINFDNLIAPKGFVITGVRLVSVENALDYRKFKTKPIELQIRVTPFDYRRRKLINLHKTYWIAPRHQSHHLRKQLILHDPDDPTKSPENVIDSKPNQFIEIQRSNLKKDAGQSTVPFFDALEAEGDPNFPLGGIAIIHRGRVGFGGFLAFKIFELDLSEYFKI